MTLGIQNNILLDGDLNEQIGTQYKVGFRPDSWLLESRIPDISYDT